MTTRFMTLNRIFTEAPHKDAETALKREAAPCRRPVCAREVVFVSTSVHTELFGAQATAKEMRLQELEEKEAREQGAASGPV